MYQCISCCFPRPSENIWMIFVWRWSSWRWAWKRRDFFFELHIGGAIGLSNCYHWTVFLDEQFESTMSISACWKANRFDFPTQLGMYRAALILIDFLSFALSWESVNEWRILAGGILCSRGNLNPPQIIWHFRCLWSLVKDFDQFHWFTGESGRGYGKELAAAGVGNERWIGWSRWWLSPAD